MSDQNRIIDVDSSTTASELEELIETAPDHATVRLAAGNYLFDDAITINRSDISLVGAGSDRTTLTFSDAALETNTDHAIRVEGGERELIGALASSVDEGERLLRLDEDHDLRPGDSVRLWQDNDEAFFEEIGDTSWRKQEHAELRTSMATVSAVDGTHVTLDRGVHFDLDAGETQIERLDTANDVTLEGFSVDFELGTADETAFDNTLEDLTGYQAIVLDGTVNGRLSDIQVIDGPSKAFHISRSLDVQVDDIEAHGAFNKGGNGNGYAYELRESYDGTFSGLTDSGMRHSLLFDSWRSSVGNDIEVASTDRDINFHGGRDHGNSVRVEQSIRDPDADEMSPTLWINEGGESFGAITDVDANDVVFDYVIGSRRDDEIRGSDDGVYLNGGLGHDTLIGGAGNDILQSGPGGEWHGGDNLLDGGGGINTALYTQDYDDYDIASSGDQVVIEGKGHVDTLENIHYAHFGDGTLLHLASGNRFEEEPFSIPSPEEILDGDGHLPALIDDTTELVVTGNTTNSWSDGYVAEIFVENVSGEEIVDPEVRFALSADIDMLWNGELVEEDDANVVTHDGPNVLAPGDDWRFAFTAHGDDHSLPETLTAQGDGSGALDVQLLGLNDSSYEDTLG